MAKQPELGPNQKSDLVMRLLQKEITLEEAARDGQVSTESMAEWRKVFILGGKAALTARRQQERWRAVLAIVLALLAGAYAAAIVLGRLPQARKIDAVDAGILVGAILGIIVLLSPETFKKVKIFQWGSFKYEALQEVRQKQVQQESQLDLILPLLLPDGERKHLANLLDHKTQHYRGGSVLQSELRRLRSMGLISMRPGRTVGAMTDGAEFDLADAAELTEPGSRWIKRIRQTLPDEDRTLLSNLAAGLARQDGSQELVNQVRHLRANGLIEMRDGRKAAALKDGSKIDLTDSIKLTEAGRDCVREHATNEPLAQDDGPG